LSDECPRTKLIWLATGAARQTGTDDIGKAKRCWIRISIKRVGIQRDNPEVNTADSTASAIASSLDYVLVLMH